MIVQSYGTAIKHSLDNYYDRIQKFNVIALFLTALILITSTSGIIGFASLLGLFLILSLALICTISPCLYGVLYFVARMPPENIKSSNQLQLDPTTFADNMRQSCVNLLSAIFGLSAVFTYMCFTGVFAIISIDYAVKEYGRDISIGDQVTCIFFFINCAYVVMISLIFCGGAVLVFLIEYARTSTDVVESGTEGG